MTPTNRQVRDVIARLDRQIATLERRLSRGRDTAAEQWLAEIRHRRYALARALLNRRIEAQKSIVNFADWRTANGLLPEPVLTGTPVMLPLNGLDPTSPLVH